MSVNTSFQLVNEKGWRRGFANLLQRENSRWWHSRRWWINGLIWLLLVNGSVLLALLTSGENPDFPMTPQEVLDEARQVFVTMTGFFGAIGTVVMMQSAIIDEKKNGTAAWIMSKPVSRPAFILSKVVANVIALPLIIVGVQGALAYVQFSVQAGAAQPILPYLFCLVLLTLHLLFYVTLTLMLGTLFNERGPVIGIPMGILFGGLLVAGFFGKLAYLMPWGFLPSSSGSGLAIEAMLGMPLSTWVPILALLVWVAVFIGIALWRFKREEF